MKITGKKILLSFFVAVGIFVWVYFFSCGCSSAAKGTLGLPETFEKDLRPYPYRMATERYLNFMLQIHNIKIGSHYNDVICSLGNPDRLIWQYHGLNPIVAPHEVPTGFIISYVIYKEAFYSSHRGQLVYFLTFDKNYSLIYIGKIGSWNENHR